MTDEYNDQQDEMADDEGLSHTDKIVALATEPGAMFTSAAKYPVNTVDWMLPIFIVLLLTIISSALIMTVPEIKLEIKEKSRVSMEKRFEEQLKKGASAEEIAKAREMGEKQLDYIGSPTGLIFQSIAILIGGFVVFLIIVGFFHLFFKLVFQTEIEFKQSLFIVGISEYVSAINIIIFAIVSLFAKRAFEGLNGTILFTADKHSFAYFFLSKIDPFSIISYLLIGIGFAKFAKSENTNKYIIGALGSWLIIGFLWFLAGKYVPFLSGFSG